MVDISYETPAETAERLKRIIVGATLVIYDQPYVFDEFAPEAFKTRSNPDALALVRDDEVWSQLVPAGPDADEPFALWRYHFPKDVDNSGFVGWFATHLKSEFGTGVFVVCGQNSRAGGIFDYWGCPWCLHDAVFAHLLDLSAGTLSSGKASQRRKEPG